MQSPRTTQQYAGFEPYIGPLEQVPDGDGGFALRFTIAPQHLNGADMLHGGMMMAFAAIVLAGTARAAADTDVEALAVNCDFTGPGKLGDVVTGRASVTRRTRTIVFLSCEIKTGGVQAGDESAPRLLMTATGVYKVARP